MARDGDSFAGGRDGREDGKRPKVPQRRKTEKRKPWERIRGRNERGEPVERRGCNWRAAISARGQESTGGEGRSRGRERRGRGGDWYPIAVRRVSGG